MQFRYIFLACKAVDSREFKKNMHQGLLLLHESMTAQRKRRIITKNAHFVLTTPPYDHHALSYWFPSINESRADLWLLQKQHGFLDFNSLGWSKGVAHNVTQGTLKD